MTTTPGAKPYRVSDRVGRPDVSIPWKSEPASSNRLVGLVVRRPPRERKVPGSKPA